jgi:hypothetical protein
MDIGVDPKNPIAITQRFVQETIANTSDVAAPRPLPRRRPALRHGSQAGIAPDAADLSKRMGVCLREILDALEPLVTAIAVEEGLRGTFGLSAEYRRGFGASRDHEPAARPRLSRAADPCRTQAQAAREYVMAAYAPDVLAATVKAALQAAIPAR